MLTSVIDMFMLLKGILTPVCYCFLKVILISLSILMDVLTLLKGRDDKC